MSRNRKPDAIKFSEGDGFFTLRCKTKEQALVLIQECYDEYYMPEDDEGHQFTLDEIKDERMYQHRTCGYTIGDTMCFECGEQCGTVGRKTFVAYL